MSTINHNKTVLNTILFVLLLFPYKLTSQQSTNLNELIQHEQNCLITNVDLIEIVQLFFNREYETLKNKLEYNGYKTDYFSQNSYNLDNSEIFFEAIFKNTVARVEDSRSINMFGQKIYRISKAKEEFKFEVFKTDILEYPVQFMKINYYGNCKYSNMLNHTFNSLYYYITTKDIHNSGMDKETIIQTQLDALKEVHDAKNFHQFCNFNDEYCALFHVKPTPIYDIHPSENSGDIRIEIFEKKFER